MAEHETAPPSPATDADGRLLLSSDEVKALLRECFAEFRSGLTTLVHVSIETTNDLFDSNEFVSEDDVADFRAKRTQWLERFSQTLSQLFERRLAGTRRQGRRPDFDASLTTLRVLNTFDHEKQAALTSSTQFLYRLTKRELDAIDLRVGALLGEGRMREVDNPFSPDYVLDAIGLSSRALYPNPRVWRPLMERLLSDVTLGINKAFIKVNRFLADHQVLPEIKAQLRARSELRPRDDAELLPTFLRLFKESRSAAADDLLSLDVAVPAASASTATQLKDLADHRPARGGADSSPSDAGLPPVAPAAAAAGSPVDATAALTAALNPYIADLARALQAPDVAPAPATGASGLPQVDPLMAIGSLSAAVAVLDRWQRQDPGIVHAGGQTPQGDADRRTAMNRIPFIRAAIDDKVVNSTDKITMDVIGLLFDYIFRDPSIPEDLRNLFTRLQVPILKTALLDRSFFSDRKHPARRLLDHLAAAAIGATGDAGYRAAFELTAAGVIEEVCRDFHVDVGVFDDADRKVQEFVDAETQKAAGALGSEVAAALAAEEGEADRSAVRALIRDKLSGLDVPFDVRSFSETIWADHLTGVRVAQGMDSDAWRRGLRTLDDLLWSLTAKERSSQKARLAKLVPVMIRDLRAGAAAVNVGDERIKPLLDAMYRLHMAAIKPAAVASPGAPRTRETLPATGAAPSEATPAGGEAAAAAQPDDEKPAAPAARIPNVHDFVADMVVGTWLAFGDGDKTVNARLAWISPLRSKYLFTTRERSRAIVATPEDLAWQLGAGKASLIVEPVALFDRAVSAALDTLAAQKRPGDAAAAA